MYFQCMAFKVEAKTYRWTLLIVFKLLPSNSKATLKKARKLLFELVKGRNWPSQRLKIWTKISIFTIVSRPLLLKTTPKVDLLKPKIIPNQFLNNSKTYFKKLKKCLFWPQKSSKHECNFCQKRRGFPHFPLKSLFCGAYFWESAWWNFLKVYKFYLINL